MTGTPGRSPGCIRGYTHEQKSLRSKLDLIIKWGRDLKSNIMKQSCKVLQTNNPNTRETIDQIHDDLDDYKRKLDRELGLIHDICDALAINNNMTKGDEENLHDEILEALRRSPTYTSLEQHMDDDTRPRIRASTIPSASQQQTNNNDDDNSQIIDDSDDNDDDEIIAISDDDDDTSGQRRSSQKKVIWTSSEIQITTAGSQSQSLHNPYRIGIADPSIRSIFLPPPNSQTMSTTSSGSKRSSQGGGANRKISPAKRTTAGK